MKGVRRPSAEECVAPARSRLSLLQEQYGETAIVPEQLQGWMNYDMNAKKKASLSCGLGHVRERAEL